jgi:predicted DNA-binding transcriptional regulator AlpA
MVPSTTLIRLCDVARIVGLRKSQIYKLIAAGEFPSPVKIGRASRWSAAEIAGWVQAKLADRDGAVLGTYDRASLLGAANAR